MWNFLGIVFIKTIVFLDNENDKPKAPPKKNKAHEMSSAFQRQRVDLLLANFAQNFPPKVVQVSLDL